MDMVLLIQGNLNLLTVKLIRVLDNVVFQHTDHMAFKNMNDSSIAK